MKNVDSENEIAETFKEIRKNKQQKRIKNKEHSTKTIQRLNVPYELKNDGLHIIITLPKLTIDFWPSTGKWIVRNKPIQSRGIRKLMQFINRNKDDHS